MLNKLINGHKIHNIVEDTKNRLPLVYNIQLELMEPFHWLSQKLAENF